MINTWCIGHKYHSWYFKVVSNFTRQTAHEITYNNFKISLVVYMPNMTTNQCYYIPIQISQIEKIQLNQTIILYVKILNQPIVGFNSTSCFCWAQVLILMCATIFMIFSLVGNFTNFTLLMHHIFMINFPQNRLVWSWHMIVWFSWIFSICEVYWSNIIGLLVMI